MARVLAALSLVALAAASSSNPAICENKLSAFFVIDNRVLDSEESTRFKDFSEEECQHACSTNRDPDGRSLLCASFTYDHKTFECVLYKDKTIPAGEVSLTADVGKRYFEKFCLAEDLPRRCGESQFIRADGHVLVGFAKNVTLTETLEECVAACVREPDCQSSMYFYEEGECIMNTESAITKPDAFQDEDTDKVVYFQNGCRRSPRHQGKRVKSHKRTTTTTTTTEAPETTTEDEVLEEPVPEEEAQEEITSTPEGTAEVESASGTEEVFEDETSTPPLSNEEEVVESSGEELLGEDQQEEEEEEDDGEEQLVDVTEEFEETNQIPKKYTKHPKNFGAKTVKEANQVADEEAEADQAEVEGELAELEQGDGSQKKHDLSIKPLKNKTQYQQSFFTEWSDWTECGPEGGRTVRRRKCLDLRKCIGALTQVKPCPPAPAEVVPAAGGQQPAEIGPIGPSSSVKSVVPEPTDRDEFALGAASSIAPPAIEGPQAPATEPERPGAWSPWLGTCQQFASGQPCSNHEMIGFESRECIAADPSQCEGPFFRYCTLPC